MVEVEAVRYPANINDRARGKGLCQPSGPLQADDQNRRRQRSGQGNGDKPDCEEFIGESDRSQRSKSREAIAWEQFPLGDRQECEGAANEKANRPVAQEALHDKVYDRK